MGKGESSRTPSSADLSCTSALLDTYSSRKASKWSSTGTQWLMSPCIHSRCSCTAACHNQHATYSTLRLPQPTLSYVQAKPRRTETMSCKGVLLILRTTSFTLDGCNRTEYESLCRIPRRGSSCAWSASNSRLIVCRVSLNSLQSQRRSQDSLALHIS